MKRLAALPAGRTDEHDVSRRTAAARLYFHLCDPVLHQAKDTIEIDGHRGAPLFVCHALDRNILNGPHAMVRD